jgi:hypothetical protein
MSNSFNITETSSKDISARGSEIYDRLYRTEFEKNFVGQYAAVDIKSEKAVVEEFPETVLERARSQFPDGIFYLIRIGSSGAFKLSRRVLDAHPRRV